MKTLGTPLAYAIGVYILAFGGCTNKPEPAPVVPEQNQPPEPSTSDSGDDGESTVDRDATVSLPPDEGLSDPPKTEDTTELEKLVARVAVSNVGGAGYKIDDAVVDELNEKEGDLVEQVIPLLASADVQVARGAAVYLLLDFNFQREDLLDGFIDLLESPDTTLRHLGLRGIKLLPPQPMKTAGPALAAFIGRDQTSENNRADAARLFIRMGAGAREWLPELQAAAADDPSQRVRLACLYTISRVAEPDVAAQAYIKALKSDSTVEVRRSAAVRLGQLESTADSPTALAAALADEDRETAAAAAESLAQLGAPAAAATATQLQNSDTAVQLLALIALAKMGQSAGAVLPQIEALVNDKDEQVQQAARYLVSQFRAGEKKGAE